MYQSSRLRVKLRGLYIQLLSDCSGSFGGTFGLQSYDFYQVGDTTHVIGIVLLAGQSVDLDRDGRVGFLLQRWKSMR